MTLEDDVFNKSTPLEVAHKATYADGMKSAKLLAVFAACFAHCAMLMPELTAQGTKVRVI